jgi:hypothetical protein
MPPTQQPVLKQEKPTGYQNRQPEIIVSPKAGRLQSKHALSASTSSAIPFTLDDATAGVENELQAVVIGKGDSVDLPLTILASNYFKNVIKKAKTGDSPKQVLTALETFLETNNRAIWENSWVRFPQRRLTRYAHQVFQTDLLADKQDPTSGKRSDAGRFIVNLNGEQQIRIPVSYLLKLALADVATVHNTHGCLRKIAETLLNHFLSDNTSPETTSFYTVPLSSRFGKGKGIAGETLLRYLTCQLLIQYANHRFELTESGQKARIYFAPNPPLRQRKLNELIPDSFYRELFMSPCLSGWDKGEDKHRYMGFCHKILSNSQLNAIVKLKEAGIISSNLVVLPNTSNTSLANNGTYVSLGSKLLNQVLSDSISGFSPVEEKYFGDLAIKVTEHFLPLFVGHYSRAPYRLDFWDFHPEKVLGYLPHQLDFTHLRMLWRRWKKKADLQFLGRRFTPFGPELFDRIFSRVCGIKGDFVTDYRLLDYFVSLLSTEQSPALNGRLGNDERLKKDLSSMGIFDGAMATYLLYRLRQHATMGFSGFEGRYYSQFENLTNDLGEAVNLQALISALAYKFILHDQVHHADIPDNPFVESERRQIFFGAAIGIPTFFVSKKSPNSFLKRILRYAERMRPSRRYQGYVRVHNREYQKALLTFIRSEGADLVEMMDMASTLNDLQNRLDDPETYAASARLTKGILNEAGASRPLKISGAEFNLAAESYYRETLRKQQMREAFTVLKRDALQLNAPLAETGIVLRDLLTALPGGKTIGGFIAACEQDVLNETLPEQELVKLIHTMLLVVDHNRQVAAPSNRLKN